MATALHYLSKIFRIGDAHRSVLLRYAVIAVTVGAISFAYALAAGWVEWPARHAPLSAKDMVDAFEANTGRHPGFRRNHAKGICVSGHFESTGAGEALSHASVFSKGVVPVVGRFSVPGTNPTVGDGESRLRSLALRFALRDGKEWRTAMNSAPIFPVRTPEDFLAQLKATRVEKSTGKPDPVQVAAFDAKHPESRAFRVWTRNHPPSSGFDNAAYYSVNAFRFIDASGSVHYVRWHMAPETPYQPVAGRARRDPDFLAHQLVTHLEQRPARWHLMLTVARPGDVVDDATQLWPQTHDHERIDAGTLVIDSAQTQIDGPCRDIEFDPLVLPAGIEPSADPLLAARSATYTESFYRRTSEEVFFASKR
ncbi:MAG TPA: catalase family peroxidase [Paraburkholderia sp.]